MIEKNLNIRKKIKAKTHREEKTIWTSKVELEILV